MPEFPKELGYLWRAYHRLRRRMAGGFAGPNPIGWQDIDAFVRQTGFRLAPWEIEAIETIDDAYLQPTAPKATPVPPGVVTTASMEDPKAVRDLMRSFGRRKGKKKGGR